MADQKDTGKQPGGQDICKFYEGQEVNYTDPNDKAVYTARIIKIYKIQNTSTIKYNPFPGAASDDSKHPVIDVNNSTLSCIPTATAVQIEPEPESKNAKKDGQIVPTIANDVNANKDGNSVQTTAFFTNQNVVPVTAVNTDEVPVTAVNTDEVMNYLQNSIDKENEFDINILRNQANDGYRIQTITAKTQDNGKYNMVILDLEIGPNTNDVDREVMKSKISRAIGTVLSNGLLGTENETTRDLTALYNAENTKAAADVPHEDVDNLLGNDLSGYKPPPDKPPQSAKQIYKAADQGLQAPQSTVIQPYTSNKHLRSKVVGKVVSNFLSAAKNATNKASTALKNLTTKKQPEEDNLKAVPKGGKLSRKRKRNMTKSKKRKVGTTRRRR